MEWIGSWPESRPNLISSPHFGGPQTPYLLPELSAAIEHAIPERTLRRWLSQWVHDGQLIRSDNRRSTRYRLADAWPAPELEFLNGLNEARWIALLAQLRDLWTHHSTAVEGNTLTLGDTHFEYELAAARARVVCPPHVAQNQQAIALANDSYLA